VHIYHITLFQFFKHKVIPIFITIHASENVELLSTRPTPKLDDHPLFTARNWLCNIFAATLRTGSLSSIRNLRTPVAFTDRQLLIMDKIHFLSINTKRLLV